MTELALKLLLNELKAIELWDQFDLQAATHDEIDRSAWESRRERHAAILALLTETNFFRMHPFDPN